MSHVEVPDPCRACSGVRFCLQHIPYITLLLSTRHYEDDAARQFWSCGSDAVGMTNMRLGVEARPIPRLGLNDIVNCSILSRDKYSGTCWVNTGNSLSRLICPRMALQADPQQRKSHLLSTTQIPIPRGDITRQTMPPKNQPNLSPGPTIVTTQTPGNTNTVAKPPRHVPQTETAQQHPE
jgi:hypothetical protein